MSKAYYHQEGREPKELDILKDDKTTLDLGNGETLVVGRCPISEDGAPGTATRGPLKAKDTEKTKK